MKERSRRWTMMMINLPSFLVLLSSKTMTILFHHRCGNERRCWCHCFSLTNLCWSFSSSLLFLINRIKSILSFVRRFWQKIRQIERKDWSMILVLMCCMSNKRRRFIIQMRFAKARSEKTSNNSRSIFDSDMSMSGTGKTTTSSQSFPLLEPMEWSDEKHALAYLFSLTVRRRLRLRIIKEWRRSICISYRKGSIAEILFSLSLSLSLLSICSRCRRRRSSSNVIKLLWEMKNEQTRASLRNQIWFPHFRWIDEKYVSFSFLDQHSLHWNWLEVMMNFCKSRISWPSLDQIEMMINASVFHFTLKKRNKNKRREQISLFQSMNRNKSNLCRWESFISSLNSFSIRYQHEKKKESIDTVRHTSLW